MPQVQPSNLYILLIEYQCILIQLILHFSPIPSDIKPNSIGSGKVWRRIVNKPLPTSMMTLFTDTFMHHQAATVWDKLRCPFCHINYVSMAIHRIQPGAHNKDAEMKDAVAGGEQMISWTYCKPSNFPGSQQIETWRKITTWGQCVLLTLFWFKFT